MNSLFNSTKTGSAVSNGIKTLLITAVLFMLCSSTAFAHPGRTDERGGHIDRSTGEYHFHHGWPEHQHYGGKCPYDFVDQSGTTYSYPTYDGNSSSADTADPKPSPQDSPKEYNWFLLALPAIGLCAFAGYSRISDLQTKRARAELPKASELSVKTFSTYNAFLTRYTVHSLREDIYQFHKRFDPLTDKAVSIQYLHPELTFDPSAKRPRRRAGFDPVIDPIEIYVYKAERGHCYHTADCPSAKNKKPIRISEIVDLQPCKTCHAERLLPGWYRDYVKRKK